MCCSKKAKVQPEVIINTFRGHHGPVRGLQRNPAFSQVELPASHHLHLTSPDLVIPHINLFCSRHGLLEVEQ